MTAHKQHEPDCSRLAAPSPALAVRDLSFRYGTRPALEHVSFEIAVGRFAALLGPNGAGKTTLFSLVTRLLEPPAGAVTILGLDLVATGSRALASLGVVFQRPTLDLDLTVAQNLAYFAALHGLDRKTAAQRIDRALDALAMTGAHRERVRTLSGGQRRRIEIARALLHKPRLLLLDEPTTGLDIPTRRAIVDYAHAITLDAGVTVLWATHLIDEIRDRDDLIVLDKGHIIAHGEVHAVIKAAAAGNLGEAFDKLIARERDAI